jgi:hypothetical protein
MGRGYRKNARVRTIIPGALHLTIEELVRRRPSCLSLDAARSHGIPLRFFSQDQDSARIPASRPGRHKSES